MFYLIFVTYSRCSCVLDDLDWTHGIGKDLVQFVNKVAVVYKTHTLRRAVSCDKRLGLCFSQGHT